MKKYQKTFILIIGILLAWGSAIAIVGVAGVSITQLNLIVPIIFAANLCLLRWFHTNHTKESVRWAMLFSLPFSLSLVVGNKIDMYEKTFADFSMVDGIYLFLLFLMITAAVSVLILQIDKLQLHTTTYKYSTHKMWGILTLVFFVFWLPYFLTYFPGMIAPDAISSIEQSLGIIPLNNHHPVLFTLFMQLILKISLLGLSLNGAIGVFTVVHMLLFAGILSYFMVWLMKKNVNQTILFLSILFTALNPVYGIFSVYITKDILFSCVLLLFILQLDELITHKGACLRRKGFLAGITVISLLVVFLRNNGIFIVLGTGIICFVIWKKLWKNMLIWLGIVLVVNGIVKGPVFHLLQIAPSSFAESASIPLQQVAHTITADGRMSEEAKAYLMKLMPFEKVKEVYEPGYTDPFKFDESFDDAYLNETKGEFIKVWFSLLPQNLDSYVKAYLMQTVGYWHIGQTESLNYFGVIENNLGIQQTDVLEQTLGISLEPIMEKLILACRKAPVLNFFTNMAAMLFVFLLYAMIQWRRKDRLQVIPLIPLFLLWGTLLLAVPVFCKYRYLFVFTLVCPYIFAKILCLKKEENPC